MILRLSLILGLAAFLPTSGYTQSSESELKEVERRLKDQADEEKRLRDEAKAREKEVAALRYRLIETANSLQDAERQIADLDSSIAALEIEKTESEKALKRESDNLSEVLGALQALELSKPPALLVSPEDANKAARAAMLLAEAAPAVDARAARLRDAIERLSTLTNQLSEERVARKEANDDLAARRDVLAELMEQKERERDVAERLASAAQKETAALAARATSLRDVVRRLERLAHRVTPRLKPPPPKTDIVVATTPTPPSVKSIAPQPYITAKRFAEARGALRPPVVGKLTGRFGADRPGGGKFEGLQFTVSDQAIVTAPFEGRVVFARDWQPIGNLIVLDVGEGFHVLLMGVGAILVEESQNITAGEPIARMVTRGASMDLEIRKNGEPVDPALWLSRKSMEELAFATN